MLMIRCIAIEDEPPALEQIRRYIKKTDFLELIGCFENALEGLAFIQGNDVDIIFLDICMPDISGVDLARIVNNSDNKKGPEIVFTTAFTEFAIEGYKLNAVDYLLKPFTYEEFYRAAEKASGLIKLKSHAAQQSRNDDFILIKVEHQTLKIWLKDILFVESLKDYVKITVANSEKCILSLMTLKAMEEKLPSEQFMRIHRSTIIALDKITAVTKTAVSICNQQFTVSENYRESFASLMKKW